MSKEMMLLIEAVSYIAMGCVYFFLSRKANLKRGWIAFIPFGTAYQRIKLANLPMALMWLHIPTVIIIAMRPILSEQVNAILFPVLAVNLLISIWIDWRVMKGFGKLGFLCLLNVIPNVGTFLYMGLLIYLTRDSETFYVDEDKPRWLK